MPRPWATEIKRTRKRIQRGQKYKQCTGPYHTRESYFLSLLCDRPISGCLSSPGPGWWTNLTPPPPTLGSISIWTREIEGFTLLAFGLTWCEGEGRRNAEGGKLEAIDASCHILSHLQRIVLGFFEDNFWAREIVLKYRSGSCSTSLLARTHNEVGSGK